MKTVITIAILGLLGLTVAGCVSSSPLNPNPTPISTQLTITMDGEVIVLVPGVNVLPEIYEAAKSPEMLENSDWVFVDGYWDLMHKGVSIPLEVEEPLLDEHPTPVYTGFPQKWDTFFMPSLSLEVDYPLDWHLETLERGIRIVSEDGSTWTSVESYPNPVQASLPVWISEYGPSLPGEVIGEYEIFILGEPALHQQVFLPKTERFPAGEYLYLWMASGEWVFHWTAWPGDQTKTYDLLMYVVSTLR